MNQRGRSFFYRGVLFFVLGGIALSLLSSIDQPWARSVRTIGGIILFIAGGAFIVFVTVTQFRQLLDAPVGEGPLPDSVSPHRWRRLVQLAVSVGVLLALALAAMLLLAAPPKRCPNWHLPDKRSSSLWLPFFILTAPVLAGLSFMVIRWNWTVRKAIESVDYPTTLPVSETLVMTVILGCGMAQFPWLLVVTQCWLRL